MTFTTLPRSAAWRHHTARSGFETVFLRVEWHGARLEGFTSAVEELDGCVDIDLESSACTNTLPIHRLGLAVGNAADAPAVYVRAADLAVERLEQRYTRLDPDDAPHRYHYVASRFDYDDTLTFDGAGLTIEYPALASRIV